MLKTIKALIVTAALACAPAFADSFNQKALIAEAVAATITNFETGGVAKMEAEGHNCYRGLDLSRRNVNRERDAQYCMAQDAASIKLYSMLSANERADAGTHFASIDDFFMAWISAADAVVRITPEQYKYYLGPLMNGAYDAMAAKFKR